MVKNWPHATEEISLDSLRFFTMPLMFRSSHRKAEYKAERKGKRVVRVDKWYPSSKTCSKCGYVHKELTLDDRVYTCPICGNVIDRDYQAAINTDTEGLRILRLSYAETA